jgi:DNA-binding NarL/FixJ family response regulator
MEKSDRARRHRILVVEDHRLLRISIVSWLECRFPGSLVHGVESGQEALEYARRADPDVVLVDINLRDIDGIEATYRMKAQAPHTGIVVLSTHDTPRHRLAAANAGAARYVAKRDMETDLEPAISALLRSGARTRHPASTPATGQDRRKGERNHECALPRPDAWHPQASNE